MHCRQFAVLISVVFGGCAVSPVQDLGYGMAKSIFDGRVAGTQFADGTYPYVWKLGAGFTMLPAPPPEGLGEALAVRGARVVGSAAGHAAMWNDGVLQLLSAPPEEVTSGAGSISDARIVGWVRNATGRVRPVQWSYA